MAFISTTEYRKNAKISVTHYEEHDILQTYPLNPSVIRQRHYIRTQVVIMLMMLKHQNTVGLIIVVGPDNCQTVRSDVPIYTDEGDGRL